MEFINGKCPKCQGELQIPKGHEHIICMYCGEKISAADAQGRAKHAAADAVSVSEEELTDSMAQMLFEIEKPMTAFTRKTYADNFTAYCEKFQKVFEEIDVACSREEQKDAFLKGLAERFLLKVEECLNEIPRKRKREEKLLDYNMVMVVFYFPALLEQHSVACSDLANTVSKSWKEHFPQTNLEPATYERINGGFKRRFCYITTAVCESQKKPDNCYELNLLRDYRDGYLISQPNGTELVRRYYDVAPTIVKHINRRDDHSEIYENVWKKYLSPCIHLIETDRNAECMEVYQKMVYDLQQKYFYKER